MLQKTLKSLDDTHALARRIAGILRAGDLVCFYGDLGAGKTTLARFLLQTLGVDEVIPSPTFTLVQSYELSPPLWHYDLYRLKDPEEIYELGLDEALREGIVLMEWPERLGPYLPKERLEIHLALGKTEDERIANLNGSPSWQSRLPSL